MLQWYKDKKLEIYFSAEPKISVIYPNQKDKKCNKPFKLQNEIKVKLIDFKKNKTFSFLISKGYCWDGASIPRFFWRLIGAKSDPRFLIPSLVHDVLCENHNYIDNDRYFSTLVFERLLYVSGVKAPDRWMMKHSVDNFQKFCGWTLEKK